jgi:hypothetical protein
MKCLVGARKLTYTQRNEERGMEGERAKKRKEEKVLKESR